MTIPTQITRLEDLAGKTIERARLVRCSGFDYESLVLTTQDGGYVVVTEVSESDINFYRWNLEELVELGVLTPEQVAQLTAVEIEVRERAEYERLRVIAKEKGWDA